MSDNKEDKVEKKFRSRWPADYKAREVRIQVAFTEDEAALIDRLRGEQSRAAWVRGLITEGWIKRLVNPVSRETEG